MNRRLVASFAIAASVLATTSAFASPLAVHSPVHAAYFTTSTPKPRMVSLNMRNDSAEAINVSTSNGLVTLAPGKVTRVRVVAGSKITADNTTPSFAAGTLIAVIDGQLNDATLSLK